MPLLSTQVLEARHAEATASRILAVAIAIVLTLPASAATHESTFGFRGTNGSEPSAGLTFGPDGAIYGTTLFGSDGPCFQGCGTVYRLAKSQNGGVTESVIHTFQGELSDGQNPTSSVIFDAAGNLYGTANGGMKGCGVVYKLSPTQTGEWTETILHNFNAFDGNNDGCIGGGNFSPTGSLIFDKSGNLFGTTPQGGGGVTDFFCQNGCGTVFRMTPQSDGSWTETVIHSFPNSGASNDGQNPEVGVLMDAMGNLYGTTFLGGERGLGLVYELKPGANSSYTEKVLFNFRGGATGAQPNGALVRDGTGRLFGTTFAGSTCSNCAGVAYMLTPTNQGEWKETVIHVFDSGIDNDGTFPQGLVMDSHGDLFGNTQYGGGNSGLCPNLDGCGTVYELSPGTNGVWLEKLLFSFDEGLDGGVPDNDHLIMDKAGNLLGTTLFGGPDNIGVVFRVTP